MNIVNSAITGNEVSAEAGSPCSALINFYHAFNQQDYDSMQSNWLQTAAASMSNPLGGIKRGWEEISEVYKKIFSGTATVYVEFYDYSIHTTEDMFIAVGRERGLLQFNNEKIELAIRTSRSYCLHEQQWKQLHHHGSMDDPKKLNHYQSILINGVNS